MSWLYSQVLVEEYLEANSLDGEQSAPSSGNLIPQAYCAPDKMKAHSRLSRFGMTFKPLTDDRGEELLMLFLEDFRAKTLAPQEKEQESKEVAAECGGTWRGLLVKFDQDLLSSKTVLCSEQEDSQRFSKTLPRWGMMRDGECSERTMPGHLISGTECGFLHMMPTPTTAPEAPNKNANTKGPKNLLEIAKTNWMPGEIWPTPTCHNAIGGQHTRRIYSEKPNRTQSGAGGTTDPEMVVN
jgi:hypothetical protein